MTGRVLPLRAAIALTSLAVFVSALSQRTSTLSVSESEGRWMRQSRQDEKRDYGELNRQIGERIHRYREEKRWTAADVQERSGVHFQTVLRLEKGESNVTPKYLEALAEVFECSPHDLLPPDATTIPLSMPERRLLDAIRSNDRTAALRAVADCLGLPAGEPELRPNPSAPLEVVDYLRSAASALTAAADALQLRNLPGGGP